MRFACDMTEQGHDGDTAENEQSEEKEAASAMKSAEKGESEARKQPPSAAGFLGSYFNNAKAVLFHPRLFFDNMPREGGLTEPAVFLVVSAAIFGVLQSIAKLNPLVGIVAVAGNLISVAIVSLLLSFILGKMGGQGNYQSTFRVLAYSKVTLLFAWLSLGPFAIGSLAALLYGIYLNILGLEKVHDIDRKRTAMVVGGLALLVFAITRLLRL